MNACRGSRGFTLLELLIAVAIFAVMAALAYLGLTAILTSRKAVETHLARLHALQQTYFFMQRDFTQAAPRPVDDALGNIVPALREGPDGSLIALTRDGYPNPANVRRSHLLRVRYQWVGHRLLRAEWPVLDRAAGDKSQSAVLLRGVRRLEFRVIGPTGESQTYWPLEQSQYAELPLAITVKLWVDDVKGPITWVFPLP